MSHRTHSRSSDEDEEKVKAGVLSTPLPQLKSDTNNDVPAETDDASLDKRNIPMRYRLMAFSMILFFATGSSYCESTISPIKSILRKELEITNAQYGAITSASSLVNTILPIIGGIGIDYWGATYAAIISSVFILMGAVISAAGANTTKFGLVIGGRILMGFGSTVIESTQNKLYAHWFAGSHLALIIGVDIAWSRITSIISRTTAVPMTNINGWWGWALWIPAIVTAANLGICIAYWAFERSIPKMYRPPLGQDAHLLEGSLKRKISWNTLTQLPRFFWVLCGTQLFQSSAVSVYSGNLADIQTQTRGTSTLAAGYNSSLQSVIPIVLTPLTGMFFDRFGWRTFFVSWTGMMYIIVFVLLGLTTVHPLAPILISSFALSTNAITFIASIPVIVGDDRLLGTAYGVWKAFNNGGSIVLDVAAGAIQDHSADNSYDNVIYVIIAIKALQVCWGPVYDFFDGRWIGHSLRLGEDARLALRIKSRASGDELKGWTVSKTAMIIVLSLLGALTVTAWVVYIVYSLGT